MGTQLVALGMAFIGTVALLLYGLQRNRRQRDRTIVPAFKAFSGEVGRVAEEGAVIHVALGSGGLLGEDSMVSVAALQGLGGLTELSAAYDTPPYITTGDPTLYLLADNQIRAAYARLGSMDHYKPGFVRFVAPSPVLYAAAAATLTGDEPVGTNINLGSFGQEVSLLSHAASVSNVKMYGGVTSATGSAALYPELDDTHLAIGEEMFAGGAEVTGRSMAWAGLWSQDFLRWLIVVGIVVAAAAALLGIGGL